VYADAVPHPERLTCALVVLLTAGCLGPASAPLACDGSSEEVAFAYQVFNASLEPGAVVMEENGGEHLFIDGACRYWAYYQRPGTLRWTEVRSGVLTGELLSEVNASLISRRWTDVDGERAADPRGLTHPGYVDVWTPDGSARCGGRCDGGSSELRSIVESSRDLTRRLHDAGERFTPDAMRAIVIPFDPPPGAFHVSEWTGPTPLSALATSAVDAATTALRRGGHVRVSGDDAAAMAELRETYRSGTFDSFSYQFLPLSSDGSLHRVYARDALPFEDDRGLVRPPGE